MPTSGDEVELRGPPVASPSTDIPEGSPEEQHHEPHVIGNPFQQLKDHVTDSYLNILYIFVPLALVSGIAHWTPAATFVLSFLGLIPLAAALGDFTEDLALRTNEAIGALINVTFGNATELIISIVALRYGQYELIKNSLVGSMLGNMLLVLGTSLVVGGLKSPIVKFRSEAAQTYMASLILATFGFVVPTIYFSLNSDSSNPHFALDVSRQIALLMIAVYVGYIYFQLRTHKHLFDAEDDDDDEEPKFSFPFAFVAIGVIATLISVLSDYLVDSVEGAAHDLRISKHFITLVLIPIVGNVAEHASSILMAAKGKFDISVGIALGSSIQIGMFVMPIICVAAWIANRPLNMNITPFIAGSLLTTVLLTYTIIIQGTANWLTGVKMFVAYLMLVIAFLNAPDDTMT